MSTPLITDSELLSMGVASNALASIPSTVRDAARATASSFALSYLRKRFTLPLTSVSDDVKRAVAHCATYDLLSRKGFNPLLAGDAVIRDRYTDAVAWLRAVASGTVEPESITDSTPAVSEAGPLVSSEPGVWRVYGSRR